MYMYVNVGGSCLKWILTAPNNNNNVAKYNLGKVRLKLMQSAVFPCTVRDPRGGPFAELQGFCVALPFLLQCCLLIFADLCIF